MTETLNKIKRDYPSFGFADGNLNKFPICNKARIITCQNEMYYLTIHDHVENEVDRFAVVATSLQSSIHYIKRFGTEGGLRLYLSSVMVLGI